MSKKNKTKKQSDYEKTFEKFTLRKLERECRREGVGKRRGKRKKRYEEISMKKKKK